MTKTRTFSLTVKGMLISFFAVTVFFPILTMFSRIRWDRIGSYLTAEKFLQTTWHSLVVTLTVTALSVSVAYVLALAVNRSRLPGKNVITILLTLPMLIPSVSHGMGLINLFGESGLLTQITGLHIGLLGFKGLVMGSFLYSFPVAFLMLSDAMKYADGTIYEAAEVLGIPRVHRFFAVTLPYMKRPLISAVFAVFTMAFTDYGVPLAVGGRYDTLPLYLYQEVNGLQDFSRGAFIGLILLLPAVAAFLIDLKKNDAEDMGFSVKTPYCRRNRVRDTFLGAFCLVVIGFVGLVLFSFVFMTFIKKYPYDLSFTFRHIDSVLNKGMLKYFGHSLVISLFTAAIGTVIGYIMAYVTARTRNYTVTRILHLTSISSLAIPGIVLGLGYATAFSGTFFYGTIAILVFVNVIHFFSSPYLMAYNALKKMNANFEDVGKTLSVSRLHLLKDVFVPNTVDTIAEMFGYFFVNSMITISAVAFLKTTRNMPLSLMINDLKQSMALEAMAFVSLVILLSNILAKMLIAVVKSLWKKSYNR